MRVGLHKVPELKIAKFIKGLSPSIANKVGLQPYLYFDDVCHLAIKVEKQLKGRKLFQTTFIHPQSTPRGYSSHNKVDTTPTPIKAFDTGKRIASGPPKWLEGKK